MDQQFFLRSWRMQEGLPNNTINAIAQTRDGYLWLGTDEGLVRFDGVHCRVFGIKEGLMNLQVSALLEDTHGALWIGTTGGGIYRMFQGGIKTYTVKDGLAGNSINCFLEDTNGSIWIGTTTGLSQLRNGIFQPVKSSLAAANIYSLAQDQSGNVWIAVATVGLYCQNQDTLKFVTWPADNPHPQPHEKNLYARRLMVDRENRLWAGMMDRSVLCFEKGNWRGFGSSSKLPHTYANCFAQTSDGTIWVGTLDKGLYYLTNMTETSTGTFIGVQKSDGLPDASIGALYAGQNQRLWIGTQSGGLTRLSPRQIAVYHVMDGDFECSKLSLAQTTNGDLWVGAFGRGIYQWRTNEFTPCLLGLGKRVNSHMTIDTMLGATDGSLWWGAGPAFFQIKAGVLLSTNFDAAEVPWLVGNRVSSLCENLSGGLWVGLDNGDLRLVKNGKATLIKGLSHRPITDLVQAADGTLWIASLGGGVAQLHDGNLTLFTTKDGLTSNLIRTLYLDSAGTLWIGTDGGGLNRLADGRIKEFTTKDGLTDDIVLQILDDDCGNLWLGCNHGICCLKKSELNDLAENKAGVRRLLPFVIDVTEGLASAQCVGNADAALKMQSGLLCFSTIKGIAVINPCQLIRDDTEPAVILEEVLVDNQPQKAKFSASVAGSSSNPNEPPPAPLIFPAGRHRFEFHFTGIDFSAPEKIQFRYLLDGWDAAWNEVGDAREAIYNLSAGNYRFRVQCRNFNGQWNDQTGEIAFVVRPYFWQTAWFRILLAIVTVGLISLAFWHMERRLYRSRLKRIEQEQATERERMRIARDLHDELGANLTHISMLSELNSPQTGDSLAKLEKRIKTISSVSLNTVRSLDEIVWAVNPRNDSLRSLILYLAQFAGELFEDTGIKCRFQNAKILPQLPLAPEMRHNIFLVTKEALNNALKHSQATEICLNATFENEQIDIMIQDNGAGFDITTAAHQNLRNGLANMRQRIESLGGQLIFESQPGQGTLVRLIVKISESGTNRNE